MATLHRQHDVQRRSILSFGGGVAAVGGDDGLEGRTGNVLKRRPNGCGGDQNASGEVAASGVSAAAVVVAVVVVVAAAAAVAVEHDGGCDGVVTVAELVAAFVAVPIAAAESVRCSQCGCYCCCYCTQSGTLLG